MDLHLRRDLVVHGVPSACDVEGSHDGRCGEEDPIEQAISRCRGRGTEKNGKGRRWAYHSRAPKAAAA